MPEFWTQFYILPATFRNQKKNEEYYLYHAKWNVINIQTFHLYIVLDNIT